MSCCFGWVLLALAAIDLRYYLLPDFLTLPLILAGLFFTWFFDARELSGHAFGAMAGYGSIIAMRQVYWRIRRREGLGLGDAKLLAASGAWVSWVGLPSVMLLGALSGLTFALAAGMRAGMISMTTRVPFGAFLCLGTWVVWLYGPLMVG